ncbi:MAG: formyl transferase [Aeromonas sp.]
MKSIVLITGDQPRHAYLAKKVMSLGVPVTWITERRGLFVPPAPDSLNDNLKGLWMRHFALRDECEAHYFSQEMADIAQSKPIDVSELNSPATLTLIRELNPTLLISYGCHKLSPELLNCFSGKAWNIHGGLSPWYRGCITHFWPAYMLEPQMTGMTLHETTDAIDGGNIIHQTAITPQRGDRLHDLAGRAVKEFCDELPRVLAKVLAQAQLPAGTPSTTSGRIWIARMWQPQHLEVIYTHFGDKIVDYCLDNGVAMPAPKLIRQTLN